MYFSRQIILRCTWIGLFITLGILSRAQEMWGITTSNYAGSNGAMLNPASIVTSKLRMDVNLATVDFFLNNNYAYLHKEDFSILDFFGDRSNLPSYGPDEMPFDHYHGKNKKFFYASELFKGPSFMLAFGRHAVALHTGARVLASGFRIPYNIANFGYYGLDYKPQQNVEYFESNIPAASLVTGEVGVTYAFSFIKIRNQEWSAGTTIKGYFPVAGAYMAADNINYLVVNDTTINIKNLNAEFGFSLPMDYDNNDFPYLPWIKGSGFSVDLGITYQYKLQNYQKRNVSKLCMHKYIDYKYKLGISILDLGFVNFTNNAQLHDFIDVNRYWINVDTMTYDNINDLTRTLSQVFYNDPDASFVDDRIRVFTPAAISIQGDYKIQDNWYAGGVFIYPIRLGKSYIHRPAQIAVIPRFETYYLEFAMPVSLFEWKYPRLGASMRYHFLTIGTDELLSLLGLTDFTGIDFYISLKFNFLRGKCGRTKRFLPCQNDEFGLMHRK